MIEIRTVPRLGLEKGNREHLEWCYCLDLGTRKHRWTHLSKCTILHPLDLCISFCKLQLSLREKTFYIFYSSSTAVGKLFCKGPEVNILGFMVIWSLPQLFNCHCIVKGGMQYENEQAWLCSSKTTYENRWQVGLGPQAILC